MKLLLLVAWTAIVGIGVTVTVGAMFIVIRLLERM